MRDLGVDLSLPELGQHERAELLGSCLSEEISFDISSAS
jgi:hypothetical protein